jgi:uncharacterized membrane protein YtjA (UPF0391 family)
MLRWSIAFFVIALVAGVLGFWGLESTAAWIAKVLFLGFLFVAVISLLSGRRALR